MTGYGTPKGQADAWNLAFVGFWTKSGWMLLVFAAHEEQPDEFYTAYRDQQTVGMKTGKC